VWAKTQPFLKGGCLIELLLALNFAHNRWQPAVTVWLVFAAWRRTHFPNSQRLIRRFRSGAVVVEEDLSDAGGLFQCGEVSGVRK
jgi:hypothetical protein